MTMPVGSEKNHRPENESPGDTNGNHENDIEASASMAQSTDSYVVDWDGPDDPHNPFNWTGFKKYRQLTGMAFNTFLT